MSLESVKSVRTRRGIYQVQEVHVVTNYINLLFVFSAASECLTMAGSPGL